MIETLAQQLPLIAIEIRTLLVKSDPPVATTFPVIFAQPDDLVLRPADEPETADKPSVPNDEASWQAAKPEFAKFAREMHKLCTEKIGPSTIDFSAKSYVALKKGKRAWLPMWPRANGAYVYIPGGPGGAVDQPNDFFAKVKEELTPLGIEHSWSFKYNAGANPIAFPIAFEHATHSKTLGVSYLEGERGRRRGPKEGFQSTRKGVLRWSTSTPSSRFCTSWWMTLTRPVCRLSADPGR
ncbi:MAG: hypothetical protein ACXW25_12970, partial [Rhodospirillales bacterium]